MEENYSKNKNKKIFKKGMNQKGRSLTMLSAIFDNVSYNVIYYLLN